MYRTVAEFSHCNVTVQTVTALAKPGVQVCQSLPMCLGVLLLKCSCVLFIDVDVQDFRSFHTVTSHSKQSLLRQRLEFRCGIAEVFRCTTAEVFRCTVHRRCAGLSLSFHTVSSHCKQSLLRQSREFRCATAEVFTALYKQLLTTHTHTHTPARTLARTHARTHTQHTHAHTHPPPHTHAPIHTHTTHARTSRQSRLA